MRRSGKKGSDSLATWGRHNIVVTGVVYLQLAGFNGMLQAGHLGQSRYSANLPTGAMDSCLDPPHAHAGQIHLDQGFLDRRLSPPVQLDANARFRNFGPSALLPRPWSGHSCPRVYLRSSVHSYLRPGPPRHQEDSSASPRPSPEPPRPNAPECTPRRSVPRAQPPSSRRGPAQLLLPWLAP
jgi:hypothetical protein